MRKRSAFVVGLLSRGLLFGGLLLSAPVVIGDEGQKLNLAPTPTANPGVNGLLSATVPPSDHTPKPEPSPVHLVVSCVDDTGNIVQSNDPRYDHCISQARGRGPMPVGATGSTQAVSLSFSR